MANETPADVIPEITVTVVLKVNPKANNRKAEVTINTDGGDGSGARFSVKETDLVKLFQALTGIA